MSILKKCNQSAISELRSFSYPMLHTGKEWYVGFNAFDPAIGVMRRKKIKVNSIKPLTQRRRYAAALIHRLTKKLETGWNPWIESENSRAYHLFTDVCDKYRQYITKLFNDGIYREETYVGYLSYLRNMEAWNGSRPVPMTYIYQFDTAVCTEFLDHIYVDRGNSVQTRNNYLTFLGVFSTFLVQHQYAKTKPCEGLYFCPKIVLLLFGGGRGKRSRETGAQVKGRDPCACAQESLPGKMKARPNGRAALSVMVCVIKTSQGDSG